MKPLVSVVIPTYNRAADLRRAIGSVRAQTFANWELLVVDNHSTDDTDSVVAAFQDSRIRMMKIHNEGSVARSRNLGIRSAAGTYVALLDSDDWWTNRKLERSVATLEAGADVVYHDLYLMGSWLLRAARRRARTFAVESPVFDALITQGNALTNSSIVVRRELVMSIGGFSEERSLISWEDYDAWLRLARVTERFRRIDEVLGYYWVGGGNMSSPQRTIDNLERFRQIYIEPGRTRELPPWFHYGLGRAYFHLKSPGVAIGHMKEALRGGLPVRKSAKALLTIAMSTLMGARRAGT